MIQGTRYHVDRQTFKLDRTSMIVDYNVSNSLNVPLAIKVRWSQPNCLHFNVVYWTRKKDFFPRKCRIRENEGKLKLIDFVYFNRGLMFNEHLAHEKGETNVYESNYMLNCLSKEIFKISHSMLTECSLSEKIYIDDLLLRDIES